MEEEEFVLELEEGELSDDSSNNYTPLERPTNYSAIHNPRFPPTQKDSETEEEVSSDSDSDSDSNFSRVKKPKIKVKPKLNLNPKRKKYDIWSTRVQEDVLAETLNSCDVTKKDRSRDVESYDYTLGAKYYGNKTSEARTSNKRTRNDRKNKNIRPNRRRSTSSEGKNKTISSSRNILELLVNSESSNEEIAKDIANKLYEEKEDLILKVVNVFGKERTMKIFEETRKIEADGGLLIMNQTRRRTPGGVFLFLVRRDEHITSEEKDKIFSEDKQRDKIIHKRKQKQKLKAYKKKLAAAKSELLPDLLSNADLLTSESNRTRDEADIKDVINPPPTPETDCHENSCDGMDSGELVDNLDVQQQVDNLDVQQQVDNLDVRQPVDNLDVRQRKIESYDDDFLDLGCSNNMDLF